jgi:hypothetical protein
MFSATEQFVCRLHDPENWAFTNHPTLAFRFDSAKDATKRMQEVFQHQEYRGVIVSLRIYEVEDLARAGRKELIGTLKKLWNSINILETRPEGSQMDADDLHNVILDLVQLRIKEAEAT